MHPITDGISQLVRTWQQQYVLVFACVYTDLVFAINISISTELRALLGLREHRKTWE